MMGGGGYDLKILNPAAARGEFLANKKLTNSLLQDPVEVGKFIDYARTKQHADFLMTGTAMITIDPAVDPATGLLTCTARIEVVGYATAGHEQIIGKSVPFYSSGNTPEACRANVSKKAAKVVAPDLARQALTYWSNRAARGRQYLVRLKGVNMPMPMRLAFTRALKSIEGVSDVESREGDGSSLEATITLKGKVEAMDVVYTAVSSQPAFAGKTLDGAETGEALTLCLGKCAPEPAKKK
jgi:hypothetical protein